MKIILYHLAALAAALAALACSSDDTAPEPAGPDNPDKTAPYTITAAFDDQTPETRISMTDDGTTKIELAWNWEDKIYVVNSAEAGSASAGTLYTFTAVYGSISQDGKTASFTCPDFPEGATPAYAVHQGANTFTYFNPTNVDITPNFNTGQYLHQIFPLYAAYDDATGRFTFRPLFALLKLKVTLPAGADGTVSSIRISSSDGAAIFYTDNYNITSGTAVRSGSYLFKYITYNGFRSFTGGAEQALYISIRPGAELAGQTLDIDLTFDDAIYSASIRGGTLEAGKCYPLTLGAAKWSGGRIYEGGTGSESDPYQLESESNLRALARSIRAGNTYSGKYFRLTKSVSGIVTSEADPWLPIGTGNTAFNGYFDGGGNTVSGTFHLSDKHGARLGFFGYVSSGSIRNLTIDGEMIYRGESNASIRIGGIAGYCTGIISGCSHRGSLTAENTVTQNLYAGGIVGYISNDISGCTQLGGTITVNAPNADVYAGGIAGYFNKSAAAMHTCRNESDITTTEDTSSTHYTGALVGRNSGTVYDCSTFRSDLTVTVNGTQQNPVKAIGYGYTGYTETVPCEDASHTAQQ